MNKETFLSELNARIAKYDLLQHPFYKRWSSGELTRNEISTYACDYFGHVASFTGYLEEFARRLPDGDLRDLVRAHKAEEEGFCSVDNRSHEDLWVDFAAGMGATRKTLENNKTPEEVTQLIDFYKATASLASSAEVIALFYAYESQVPRIAEEKERGLQEFYGADERTSYYFALHKNFDKLHSQSWMQQLVKEVGEDEVKQSIALLGAETAASMLWKALSGIENKRALAACA